MSGRPSSLSRARQSARQQWQAFRRSEPGKRFQEYHERQQKERKRGFSWARPLRWVLAAVCLAIGVVLAVMPGPAFVFFGLAGALIAADSRPVARLLDWLEVKIRAIVRPLLRRWRRFGPAAKTAIASVAALSGAALSIAVWFKLRG